MQRALKVLAGISVLVLAMSAVAAENSGKFILPSAAELNGKSLAAGEYKVRWEGQGPDVQVTVSRGKETIATAPAKLVDRGEKAPRNAVVMNTSGGGAGSIVELRLSGKRSVLVFNEGAGWTAKQAQ